MKIGKIIKDNGDYVVSSAKTRKAADLLEQSKEFEKGILYLRKKYKIPNTGYPYPEDPKDYPKYAMEVILDDKTLHSFFNEAIEINKALSLPRYWWGSIAYFAFHNVLITPERISIEIHYFGSFMAPNEHIFHKSMENRVKDRSVFIEITEKISKERLHQLIDQEWEDIKKGMDLNLFEMPHHRMIRASLAKRIVEMRDTIKNDKTKMRFREITNVLQKENQDNDLYDILSEDYVKNLYHRWKGKRNKGYQVVKVSVDTRIKRPQSPQAHTNK